MEAELPRVEQPLLAGRAAVTESLAVALLLSIAGGFLDAFTWLAHGKVFANAQTGNVVFLGIYGALGEWPQAIRHLPPIVAFSLGAFVAYRMLAPLFSLSVGILLLIIVAALPHAFPDIAVTVGISFTAALQTASFRKVESWNFSSVTVTGNLLRSMEQLAQPGIRATPRGAAVLAAVCAGFWVGAATGAFLTVRFANGALAIPVALLSFVLWLCRRRLHGESRPLNTMRSRHANR